MNKEIGEHKQKIVMNVNLRGIKLVDEKTQVRDNFKLCGQEKHQTVHKLEP